MQDFCPLCLRNGVKKRIKLLQINLQEAVWACEAEKCIWPFGYEDFIYFPRAVGKIWSCYWDDQKPPAQRFRENAASSAEPSLSNPIVTLSKNNLKDVNKPWSEISNFQATVSSNVTLSEEQVKTQNLVQKPENTIGISTDVRSNRDLITDNTESSIEDKNISSHVNLISDGTLDKATNINCNNSKLIDDGPKTVNTTANNVASKSNSPVSFTNPSKEQIDSPPNIKENISNSRSLPKVTSIETVNISTINMKTTDQSFVSENPENKTLKISKAQNTTKDLSAEIKSTDLTPVLQGFQHTKLEEDPLNVKNAATNSDVNITTIQMEGLPQITVSYKIPSLNTLELSNSAISTVDQVSNASSEPAKNTRTVKRHITSGKQYTKFSFSAIKKKIEANNSDSTTPTNNACTDKKPSSKDENTDKNSSTIKQSETAASVTSGNLSNQSDDPKSNGNISPANISENFNRKVDRTIASCNENSKQTHEVTKNVSNQTEGVEPVILSELTGKSVINSNKNSDSTNIETTSNLASESDNSAVNTSINLDTVLEDFLTNDYSVSEDINDEWINSLLS